VIYFVIEVQMQIGNARGRLCRGEGAPQYEGEKNAKKEGNPFTNHQF
jgi:hypothetical protein